MSVLRIVAVAAVLAVAASAQPSSPFCGVPTQFFARSNGAACPAYLTAETALCRCFNSGASTSTAATSCLANLPGAGSVNCSTTTGCINTFFMAIEAIPAQNIAACSTYTTLWSNGVLSAVLANPTNFSASSFAVECGAAVCQLTWLASASFCWPQVGGGAYYTLCSSFSVFGNSVYNATNMTAGPTVAPPRPSMNTTTNSTPNAPPAGPPAGGSGAAPPTTTSSIAPATTKSAAAPAAALLAVVAAVAAVAAL